MNGHKEGAPSNGAPTQHSQRVQATKIVSFEGNPSPVIVHDTPSIVNTQVDNNFILGNLPLWVGWRYQVVPGSDKRKKPPVSPITGGPASPTDPATWGTYSQAAGLAKSAGLAGVGLVLTHDLGLTLVDLDHCFDDGGQLLPYAAAIVDALDSYTEYSPSGQGLHILVWGRVATLKTARVELYSDGRYTTVTGRVYGPGRAIRTAQPQLDALRAEYAPPTVENKAQPAPPAIFSTPNADDAAVIDVLLSIPKYAALWAGSCPYTVERKDNTVKPDYSRADFALINGLIWLVGPDLARVEKLFRQSGLYRDGRHDRSSGKGYSNLAVSIYNAASNWRGTPYDWNRGKAPQPAPEPPQPTAQPQPAPEPPQPTLGDKLQAARLWARDGGLSQFVDGRKFNSRLAVLDALCEMAQERGRLDGLAVGLSTMRRRAGLASTGTVRAALDDLCKLGWVLRTRDADGITRCAVYEFTPVFFTCRKLHVEDPAEKTMQSTTSENYFGAHRGDDTFSTGGGVVGEAWGNASSGLGKLPLLLIDILKRDGLPMTVKMLAQRTGRNERTVSYSLRDAYRAGLLEREQENGRDRGRRFWYSVPTDVDTRSALAATEMDTFGASVDLAAYDAFGLVNHAQRLLDRDAQGDEQLTDAQRNTLRKWVGAGGVEFRGLSEILDYAKGLAPDIVRERIQGAQGANVNTRAMRAAREFKANILADAPPPVDQAVRLFRAFASVAGYPDLSTSSARITVTLALKTLRNERPQPARPIARPQPAPEPQPAPQPTAQPESRRVYDFNSDTTLTLTPAQYVEYKSANTWGMQ